MERGIAWEKEKVQIADRCFENPTPTEQPAQESSEFTNRRLCNCRRDSKTSAYRKSICAAGVRIAIIGMQSTRASLGDEVRSAVTAGIGIESGGAMLFALYECSFSPFWRPDLIL
jgi:hypothetical protein